MTYQPAVAPREPARATRYRVGRCYVRCAGEGEQVLLAFPYDAALVGEAKAIGGRRFDWATKTNIFPFDRLPQVVAFADAHGIDVAPQVRALVPAAAAGVRKDRSPGRATRQAAHLYLGHGLLPVPAWAITDDGVCRCPRGAACPRPGKHPRSVPAGPGPRGYSWRPLACSTHEDVERRFAGNGRYAAANLMLAIPEGMLVIDQDFDDGGHQALATLADRLGDLSPTLSHHTPHGMHRIYRTPAGWMTRAWVGKDSGNPLPAGIDLRVPGQILMAPPSRVPAAGELACYGPVTGTAVADLPVAYIAAWTPPTAETRVAGLRVPVPPGRADAAASYVQARITGIAEDLAARKPGGRNTAIYTAALKVGSTLGAARSAPSADQAVAAWTDEAAEAALMAAAEQNGYVADHSAAEARSAIRSGLRNGFRDPRPLPDFGSPRAASGPARDNQYAGHQPRTESTARSARCDHAASPEPGTVSSACLPAAVSRERPAAGQIAAPNEADRGERANSRPRHVNQAGTGDWRDAIVQKERGQWQPEVALPGSQRTAAAEARGNEIGR